MLDRLLLDRKLFAEFLSSERLGAYVLLTFTALSLLLANLLLGDRLQHFFHQPLLGMPLEKWVNDGLMAIFFLLIGLELEREIYTGELSRLSKAALPIIAAAGGMIVPAGIHLLMNYDKPTASGAGIPMATDIAFSLGILALFSTRAPYSLKVFLTALAIADDLGAILVIALFYTRELFTGYLLAGSLIFAMLLVLNRMRIHRLTPYLLGGVLLWWCFLQSGVHATISGVLLAFAVPFNKEREQCVSYRLQHHLHFPVALGVLPLFAFTNTCIPLGEGWYRQLVESNSLGIILGLVVGKPLGIVLFCLVAVRVGLGHLPADLRFTHLIGAGLLAGVGFTMSIFISGLAFEDHDLVNFSQISVLVASTIAAILGGLWFATIVPKITPDPGTPVS